MLTSGDVVDLDLGTPEGREAGFRRPGVIVTAQRVLDREPSVVHVVPLTSTFRRFESEVTIEPDPATGVDVLSSAQCQHIRSVAAGRISRVRGSVGPIALSQVRLTIAVLLDIPG
jgi:mRNA interferase MazF